MTSQKLFNETIADGAGTGWKVSFDIQYRPWVAAADADDPRPSLTGVYIDPAGWAIASDGFCLAVIPVQIQPGILQSDAFKGAIVPGSFIKAAHASSRKRKLESAEISIVGARAHYEVPGGGTWCDLILATYANWRNLIQPRYTASKNVAVDPDLVSRISEAIGGAYFRWQSGVSENTPFLMTGRDGESFGLVMPVLVELRDPPMSLIERALRAPEIRSFAAD